MFNIHHSKKCRHRNKPKSEKPLCLVIVRLGIARHPLPYLLHNIQSRHRKLGSSSTTKCISSIRVVPTVAWSTCIWETCTCVFLCTASLSPFWFSSWTINSPGPVLYRCRPPHDEELFFLRECHQLSWISIPISLGKTFPFFFFQNLGEVQHFQPPGTYLQGITAGWLMKYMSWALLNRADSRLGFPNKIP